MKVMTLKKNGHVVIEEVPTNSASSGAIAGLPPDEPPVRKKRKNKICLLYTSPSPRDNR